MSASDLKTNSPQSGGSQNLRAELRLRCPGCYKLYTLDPRIVYVKRPEFNCSQCNQKFWISFPEALEHSEVVAFPVEWHKDFKSEIETEQVVEETLDPTIVEKISEDITTSTGSSSLEEISNMRKVGFIDDYNGEVSSEHWFLEKSWEKVLNNYDVKSSHKEFIQLVKSKKELDFAYNKYKDFCEVNAHDPIAKEMRTYVEKLIQDQSIQDGLLDKKAAGLRRYRRLLPWVSMLIAGGCIALGFMNEGLSDLAGIGFGLIFLTGALSLLKESNL